MIVNNHSFTNGQVKHHIESKDFLIHKICYLKMICHIWHFRNGLPIGNDNCGIIIFIIIYNYNYNW